MQSSNHIGKIVQRHAGAVESGKAASRKRRAKSTGGSPFNTVPKHRAFVPLLTIWAGLLLGLIIAVLPDFAIARASSLTGIYLPLLVTRIALSLGIGLCGALLGFIVASALSNRAQVIEGDGILVSAFKSRDVDPINPSVDLGSESFDAPIGKAYANEESEPDEAAEFFELDDSLMDEEAEVREPNLGELAQRGYDIEAPEDLDEQSNRQKKGGWAFTRKHFKDALIESCEGATCEASPGPDQGTEHNIPEHNVPEPVQAANKAQAAKPEREAPQPGFSALTPELVTARSDKPRSLDLGEFAELPGRNAVWVEDAGSPRSEVLQEPASPKSEPVQTPQSALEKLRQKPAEELSLVEMVERFAAALHNHQAQERKRYAEGQVARETALAEALKALSLFTEAGFDKDDQPQVTESQIGQTEGELRAALERLQQMRGAA